MKRKILSIIFFILITFPTLSSEKIAYLDVEKIMQDSIAGKSIISQMKKKRETAISNFKKKEKQIIEKEKKLISQKNILSKEEFENANAVSFNVAIQLFSVFLRGLLVAEDQHILLLSHNSFRSDKIVLEHELIRHRMHRCLLQLPLFFFDTLHFVRAMKPKQKSYSLNSLYELFFHKRIKNAHAARSDVGALEEILKKINKPYEGVVMMLFLTPFSNINGIGLQTEKKIMSAGYSCLEHFYSVNGIFTKNIIDGLIQLRIFHDIALLNRISMEMTRYGIKRLTV